MSKPIAFLDKLSFSVFLPILVKIDFWNGEYEIKRNVRNKQKLSFIFKS